MKVDSATQLKGKLSVNQGGYLQAQPIDKQISNLMDGNPVTDENRREWRTFERTIRSGLNLLQQWIEAGGNAFQVFVALEHPVRIA